MFFSPEVDDITVEEPIEQHLPKSVGTKSSGGLEVDHHLDSILPTLDPATLEKDISMEDLVNIDSKTIEAVFMGMEGVVPEPGGVLPSPITSE